MKQLELIHTDRIFGAVTLKDLACPESNNMALHVCQDPQAVMQNRKALEAVTLPLENWALPWQKHTANIYRITNKDKGRGSVDKNTSIMNVDALYTIEPDILIGVFTADCCGILLVDPSTPCIATIHSGWKGTVQSITEKCARQLIDEGLLHPERTLAFFSPSILFDSLEVGMEVVQQLLEHHVDIEGCIRYMPDEKAYIDNQGINIKMLRKLGITQITPSTLDTKKERNDCFSYRNEKEKVGEHFTYAYIKG
jgi:YfiH family protein